MSSVPPAKATGRSRRWSAALLLLLVVASVAAVAVPVWLIRPFAPQTDRGIAIAYTLRRWAPALTALALAATPLLLMRFWSGARWWSRTLLVLALVPLVGAAWLARFNIFEKMFAPLPQTQTAASEQASWVKPDEPVMAVTVGSDAAAYPVRLVAYHHIVHDVVGGVPIAVTY
jgi:hypothetical protein